MTDDKKKGKAVEYRFKIDSYTPERMPMARLAEYLTHLASILGAPESVHLMRIMKGSLVLVNQIDREAVPKVRDRAVAVRSRVAPRDALAAYETINRLLREDNGVAGLREGARGPTILEFPGREETQETFPSVHQYGSIDGEVVRVGGKEKFARIILLSEQDIIANCYADRAVAKRLGERLYEQVRLFGHGTWGRDAEGRWILRGFRVTDFTPLRNTSLSEALDRIRAIPSGLDAETSDDLAVVRHGRTANGGD